MSAEPDQNRDVPLALPARDGQGGCKASAIELPLPASRGSDVKTAPFSFRLPNETD